MWKATYYLDGEYGTGHTVKSAQTVQLAEEKLTEMSLSN